MQAGTLLLKGKTFFMIDYLFATLFCAQDHIDYNLGLFVLYIAAEGEGFFVSGRGEDNT